MAIVKKKKFLRKNHQKKKHLKQINCNLLTTMVRFKMDGKLMFQEVIKLLNVVIKRYWEDMEKLEEVNISREL